MLLCKKKKKKTDVRKRKEKPWRTRRRVKAQTTRTMETVSPTISSTRRDITNP
jgi:hypothetical protein